MTQSATTAVLSQPVSEADEGSVRIWIKDVIDLTKARLTMLVVITAWLGFSLGYQSAGQSLSGLAGWVTLLAALAGTGLASMGAGAINQVMERDADSRMRRTRRRPVAAGRWSRLNASLLGVGLVVAGLLVMAVFTHALALLLTFATVILYVAVYTPLKRLSWTATLVGAVPGAMPPLIGYAAATGTLGPGAWAMFLLMVAWQMPHFYAIAWLYREDYERGGFPMLPVIDPEGRRTFRQILSWCVALLVLTVAIWWFEIAGMMFLVVGLLAGLAFTWPAVRLILRPEPGRARTLFLASLVYLPVLLAFLALDYG